MLTLNMSGAKEVSSLGRFLCCFGGSGDEKMGEDAGMTMQSLLCGEDTGIQLYFSSIFLPLPHFFLFPPDATVIEPELQL